jgi:hypothetical protein
MIEFLASYVNVFTVAIVLLIAFGLAVASEAVHNSRLEEAFDRVDATPDEYERDLLGEDYRDHVREFAAKKYRRQQIINRAAGR